MDSLPMPPPAWAQIKGHFQLACNYSKLQAKLPECVAAAVEPVRPVRWAGRGAGERACGVHAQQRNGRENDRLSAARAAAMSVLLCQYR
eukprot:6191017-Pleurochrysis_carterae.AAC.2